MLHKKVTLTQKQHHSSSNCTHASIHHSSLLLSGVSIVSALFLLIIILILKVFLTKLPHTTLTTIIRYGPTTAIWRSAELGEGVTERLIFSLTTTLFPCFCCSAIPTSPYIFILVYACFLAAGVWMLELNLYQSSRSLSSHTAGFLSQQRFIFTHSRLFSEEGM